MGLRSGYNSVFVHVHTLERPRTLYQQFKLHILKRSVNRFVAVSDTVRKCLRLQSIKNVNVIHNAVDIKKYSFHSASSQEKFGFPKNTFLLGMVGRIVKDKGYDHFVHIIQGLQNVAGVIVGEGPYEDKLKAIITEKNLLDRIKFIPFQSQENLPTVYSQLDAFFLFSEREGLPLALLESQSVGVPYIGNAVGGIGEVIRDGYNGFILDELDIKQIESNISQLKKNYKNFRNNARKITEEKYSIEALIGKIEQMYMESLS